MGVVARHPVRIAEFLGVNDELTNKGGVGLSPDTICGKPMPRLGPPFASIESSQRQVGGILCLARREGQENAVERLSDWRFHEIFQLRLESPEGNVSPISSPVLLQASEVRKENIQP